MWVAVIERGSSHSVVLSTVAKTVDGQAQTKLMLSACKDSLLVV